MEILHFGGYKCCWLRTPVVLVLGEYQISIATYLSGVSTRISNLKEIRGIFFEFTSSGSTGGRGSDAKTIISLNTSFGDIIRKQYDKTF